MRFIKRREADAGMQGYEQRIFNKMFEEREDVSPMILQLSTPQAVQAAKKELADGFTKNPFRRIFTRRSRVVQVLSCLFSGCCIGVFAGVTAYTRTYSVTNFVLFGLLTMAVYFGLAAITCSAVNRLPRHGNVNYVIASFSVNMVIAVFAGFIMIGMSNLILPVLVGVVGAMLCNIFAAYGLKRTEQGNRWLEELLGFRSISARWIRRGLMRCWKRTGIISSIFCPMRMYWAYPRNGLRCLTKRSCASPSGTTRAWGPLTAPRFRHSSLLYRQIFGAYLFSQAYAGAQQDHSQTGGGSFGGFGGGAKGNGRRRRRRRRRRRVVARGGFCSFRRETEKKAGRIRRSAFVLLLRRSSQNFRSSCSFCSCTPLWITTVWTLSGWL